MCLFGTESNIFSISLHTPCQNLNATQRLNDKSQFILFFQIFEQNMPKAAFCVYIYRKMLIFLVEKMCMFSSGTHKWFNVINCQTNTQIAGSPPFFSSFPLLFLEFYTLFQYPTLVLLIFIFKKKLMGFLNIESVIKWWLRWVGSLKT